MKVLSTLFFCLLLAQNSFAGDVNIELGDGIGVVPTGEYVDSLDQAALSKSLRYALKYTFESGLILGREEFNSASAIKDASGNAHLFVTVRGFTAGWSVGDKYRFAVEAGIPEKATVSRGVEVLSIVTKNTDQSQSVDAQWFGVSFDWGVFNEKGDGWGLLFLLRQVTLKTENLFESNKSFDASGLYFGGALRYRL